MAISIEDFMKLSEPEKQTIIKRLEHDMQTRCNKGCPPEQYKMQKYKNRQKCFLCNDCWQTTIYNLKLLLKKKN